MINWNLIDLVLLDMDGTLLDLHFDNHFWQEHVPKRFGEKNGLTLEMAKSQLSVKYRKAEGSLDWYCVDYWSRELDLDIAALKAEINHLICMHPNVIEFLDRLRSRHIKTILVTNAHQKSLALKMDKTRLAGHIDKITCAHDFGLAKETTGFWQIYQQSNPFNPARTLLIDDSLPVLKTAQEYGIAYLLGIQRPDSKAEIKKSGEFDAIKGFHEIMPEPV